MKWVGGGFEVGPEVVELGDVAVDVAYADYQPVVVGGVRRG